MKKSILTTILALAAGRVRRTHHPSDVGPVVSRPPASAARSASPVSP